MTELLLLIKAKALLLVAGAGGAAALFAARKFIPSIVSKFIGAKLQGLLNMDSTDPIEKALLHDWFIATVKIAEYKLSQPGSGDKRRAFALDLAKRLGVPPEIAAELVELAVKAMDDELEKALKDNPEAPKS